MSEEVQYSRTLRGLPLWLLREYLVELGGSELPDGSLRGEGWTATISQLEDMSVGVLRVGQVLIDVQATPVAAELFFPILEKKLLRAGG